MLLAIETHPIQYHAPVFRSVQERCGIPVTVVYGSDFSIRGYQDKEFGETFKWDTDLLSGYQAVFLSRVEEGGARNVDEVSAQGLAEVIDALSPTSVLIGGYAHRLHRAGLRAARKRGLPILFRGETNDAARERGFARRIARDATLRSLYRRCARLLYIGAQSQRHYERLGVPDEKLVFSPYCVDTSSFESDEPARERLRADARATLHIPEDQRVMLFSGKLSPRKGPDLLIAALKLLSPELRSSIAILFLGNGELKNTLENQARQDPSINAVFAGFKNQSQLSPYYHAADLFVLPSRHSETWGLVVNEALHHGLPCVVSRAVGCAPDLVSGGITGEVFETDSAGSLAAAIRRAVELIDGSDVRTRCREQVSGYSVERAAEGVAEAYRAVTPQMDFALA